MNTSANNFENEILAGHMDSSFNRRLRRNGSQNAFDYINLDSHKTWSEQPPMKELTYNPFIEMFE
tara:strand:+ start:718 stop:912 length:195 start_codon:yes stop_codon:yes gene_type:complete